MEPSSFHRLRCQYSYTWLAEASPERFVSEEKFTLHSSGPRRLLDPIVAKTRKKVLYRQRKLLMILRNYANIHKIGRRCRWQRSTKSYRKRYHRWCKDIELRHFARSSKKSFVSSCREIVTNSSRRFEPVNSFTTKIAPQFKARSNYCKWSTPNIVWVKELSHQRCQGVSGNTKLSYGGIYTRFMHKKWRDPFATNAKDELEVFSSVFHPQW